MSYTYHIAFTGTAYTEFIPSEEPKIVFQEMAGEMFLRPVIDEIKIGGLLNASAYSQLVTNFFDPTTFGTQLKIRIDRNGVEAFNFRTSVCNTKIDTEKKTFMVAPEPDDSYQDVLDKYDINIDIAALMTGQIYPYVIGTNLFVELVPFTSFTDVAHVVTYDNQTAGVSTARMNFIPSVGSGDEVFVVVRGFSSTGANATMQILNNVSVGISNTITITGNGSYVLTLTGSTPTYILLSQDATGGNSTGAFTYEIWAYSVGDTTITGRLLNTLLDDALGASYWNTGLTMRSTYLFNDALPPEAPASIIAYIAANPTHNYVTSAANRLNSLYLSRTDDLTTDKADNHEITFKQLMDILKQKLRAYWYIDTDGYFRIEHEQYFREMDVQIDLTSVTYEKFKPEIDMLLYTYDKSDNYSIISYSENNEGNADFIADDFIYDYIKTSTKQKEVTINISTDISWIVANPGDATSEGFALIETETLNTHVVPVFEASRTAGYYLQNQYLSWYSIFPKFFKYFGEADEADINNGTTLTLLHVKEILRQGGMRFYHNGILTFYNPVTLSIGTAWIKKMELDLSSGFYALEVGYDPYNL